MIPAVAPKRRPTSTDAGATDAADAPALGREMLAEVRAIRALVEALVVRGARGADPCRVQLLEALAATMEGFDLEFTASEVLERRHSDCGLDAALAACHIADTATLGAVLRELRDQSLAGVRVVRDGRAWRLERT
jgi:hypothetical protein